MPVQVNLEDFAKPWRPGIYPKSTTVIYDNQLWILNDTITGLFTSSDFLAEVANGDWIGRYTAENEFANVAFSGDYNDLDNLPIIPDISDFNSKKTFEYNTGSLCIFNFPATSNWTKQGGFFGMGAYGSARSDSSVSNFLTLIASSAYGSLIGGIAPFDMKLATNQSFVTQNANLVGGDLKLAVGYIDLNYVTGVRSNATIVDEGIYTPESNGLVDLREDFGKEITIPKGALWLYSWAHTKTSAVSSVYIQTILNFEEA